MPADSRERACLDRETTARLIPNIRLQNRSPWRRVRIVLRSLILRTYISHMPLYGKAKEEHTDTTAGHSADTPRARCDRRLGTVIEQEAAECFVVVGVEAALWQLFAGVLKKGASRNRNVFL